jgi:hypothetical protein
MKIGRETLVIRGERLDGFTKRFKRIIELVFVAFNIAGAGRVRIAVQRLDARLAPENPDRPNQIGVWRFSPCRMGNVVAQRKKRVRHDQIIDNAVVLIQRDRLVAQKINQREPLRRDLGLKFAQNIDKPEQARSGRFRSGRRIALNFGDEPVDISDALRRDETIFAQMTTQGVDDLRSLNDQKSRVLKVTAEACFSSDLTATNRIVGR